MGKQLQDPEAVGHDKSLTLITLALAGATILIHGYLIFYFLNPTQLNKYLTAAEMILGNNLPKERLLDFSPLYLYLHVTARRLFSNPTVFLQCLQITVVATSSSLLFLLLHRFFSVWIAVLGSLVFILDRSVIVYDQAFEPEPLVILFLLGFLLFCTRSGFRNHFLAGILFALGLLTRPNFLLVALVVPFYFFVNQKNPGRWLRSALYFGIPVVIALVGLWVRNARITGYFSPFVMNPGTAIFEGNNPSSKGLSSVYPPVLNEIWENYRDQPDYQHELYRNLARKITGKDLSIPEVNSYWTKKAFHFLQDHPRHALDLLTTKIFNFFNEYNWHDLANTYWNDQKLKSSMIPTFPFAAISSGALIGMLLLRDRWRSHLLFYAVIFSQFAFMMVVYVSARQRVSIISIFILFFCSTLQFLIEKKKMATILILFVPLVLLLRLNTDLMKEEGHLWSGIRSSNHYRSEASRKRQNGLLEEAARDCSQSLAAAPWYLDSRRLSNLPFGLKGFAASSLPYLKGANFSTQLDRAVLLTASGNFRESESILMDLTKNGYAFKRDQYQSSEPYFYLALDAERQGDHARAIELYKTALQRSPGDPWTLSHLVALSGNSEYHKMLFRYFDDVDARFFLGQAYLENGDGTEAVKCFSYVLSIVPNYRRALIYLAAALGKNGHYEQGITPYREAIKMRPDPVLLEKEILFLFRNYSEQKPEDIYAQYSYGIVLRQFGHYQEALAIQEQALLSAPDTSAIQKEIEFLNKVIHPPKN